MDTPRRTIQGGKGRYELLLTMVTDGLSHHHLALDPQQSGDARFVVVRESLAQVKGDPNLSRTLLSELRVTTRFNHPCLPRAIEAGSVGGVLFSVHEYLLGEGLGSLIQTASDMGQSLPPALALAIVGRAASGLHQVHQIREQLPPDQLPQRSNLSPSNIVVGYAGWAKLVASDRDPTTVHTRPENAGDAVAYASPEHCTRQGIDARSDIFSLGIILWELLAQRPLFRRVSHKGTIQAIIEGQVPPMKAAERDVDDEMERVVTRALALDPADRYQTALEFAQALDSQLAREPAAVGEAEISTFVRTVLGQQEQQRRALLERSARGGASSAELSGLLPDTQVSLAWPRRPKTTPSQSEKGALAGPSGPSDPDEERKFEQQRTVVPSLPPRPPSQSGSRSLPQPDNLTNPPPPPPPAAPKSPIGPAQASAPSPPAAEQAEPQTTGEAAAAASAAPAAKKPARPATSPTMPVAPETRPPEPAPAASSSSSAAWLVLVLLLLAGIAATGLWIWPGFLLPAAVEQPAEADAGMADAGDGLATPPTEPRQTTLAVRSEPAGCAIRLDEVKLPALTPTEGLELEPGREHSVSVFCAGHQPDTLRFKPSEGEQLVLAFNPEPRAQGLLKINTNPWTEVYLGERKLGITPLTGIKLPEGKHLLRLVNSGAKIDKTLSVKIVGGKTTSLFRKLGR